MRLTNRVAMINQQSLIAINRAKGTFTAAPLLIVNYDTSYQDSLLARHSSNKFDSALAALRNCEL